MRAVRAKRLGVAFISSRLCFVPAQTLRDLYCGTRTNSTACDIRQIGARMLLFVHSTNPTAYVPTYPQSDLIELHSLCHQCYGRIFQFSNLYYGATVRRVSGLDSLDFTVSHSRPHFPPQLAIDLPRAGVRYSRIAVTPHHLSPPVVSIRSTRPY